MAETILGIGHQKSIRDIIRLIEREIRRTHGSPRKIVAKTRPVQIAAEREDFDGSFNSYTIHIRKIAPETLEQVRAIVSEHSTIASVAEEEEAQAIRVKGEIAEVDAVIDALSELMGLPEVWSIQGDNFRVEHVSIETLFKAMVQYKASDVHLSPGETPVFRVDNQTHRSDLFGELSAPQISSLLRELTSELYWSEFREQKQTSFNFHQVGLGYSRISAFIKAGAPHVTIRFLPENIPSFDDLHIPSDTMVELGSLHHGLVLVTGMTGSGKSTTVAALVDWINTNKQLHILTIEHPVEYVHRNKKSIMSQRGTGIDVANFRDAVTGALRHDPDVIVIGEMRDPDTIRAAINAAATGHLVISTLHVDTAYEVVNRIVSFFDPVERDLVRLQLRDAIQCIICQRLVPKKGGGRQPALEFLLKDIKAISDGIITGNSDAIRIGMQQTTSHSFLFEDYLYKLYKSGVIDTEAAHDYATDASILDQMLMGTYTVPRLESIKHHTG